MEKNNMYKKINAYMKLEPFKFLTFDSEGLYLYTNGETLGSLNIWDLTRREIIKKYQLNTNNGKQCNGLIAYRDDEEYIKIFDTNKEMELYQLDKEIGKELSTNNLTRLHQILNPLSNTLYSFISSNLFVYIHNDTLNILDLDTKELISSFTFKHEYSTSFNKTKGFILKEESSSSPFILYNFKGEEIKRIEKKGLCTHSGLRYERGGLAVELFDVNKGKVLDKLSLNLPSVNTNWTTLSHDGNYIISCYWNELYIYEIENGILLDTYSYPNVIKEVIISNNDKTLIILSFEGDLSLFNLNQGKLIPSKSEFKINLKQNPSITFSYDNQWIFIGYINGYIYKYPLII